MYVLVVLGKYPVYHGPFITVEDAHRYGEASPWYKYEVHVMNLLAGRDLESNMSNYRGPLFYKGPQE